jgi:hypothetical protein
MKLSKVPIARGFLAGFYFPSCPFRNLPEVTDHRLVQAVRIHDSAVLCIAESLRRTTHLVIGIQTYGSGVQKNGEGRFKAFGNRTHTL